jgi:hypothetical protein
MKKLTLLTFVILATITGFAQPPVKLYGYSQSHLPGMVPKGSSGNGAKTETTLYFQFKASDKVRPTMLWLDGKKYRFKLVAVKTPVVQINKTIPSNPVKTVLIPANGLYTFILSDLSIVTKTYIHTPSKLVSSNAVVIEYEWKGKKYYKTLKKLRVLEPLANE